MLALSLGGVTGQHVSCEVQHGSSLGAASNGPAGAQSTPRQPANAVAVRLNLLNTQRGHGYLTSALVILTKWKRRGYLR